MVRRLFQNYTLSIAIFKIKIDSILVLESTRFLALLESTRFLALLESTRF